MVKKLIFGKKLPFIVGLFNNISVRLYLKMTKISLKDFIYKKRLYKPYSSFQISTNVLLIQTLVVIMLNVQTQKGHSHVFANLVSLEMESCAQV